MRRHEAVALVALAVLLTIAGVTWLFGPWGLTGSGVALAAIALFAVDVPNDPPKE